MKLRPRAVKRSVTFRRRVAGGTPDPPAPFICGAGRSGTTLLRLMLDAHPQLAIPGESHFIPDLIRHCLDEKPTAESVTRAITESNRWGDFHLDADELGRRIAALDDLRAATAIREFFRLYAEGQGKARWGDKTPGYAEQMVLIERALPEARFVHVVRDGRDVALSLLSMTWGPDTVGKAAKRWRKRITKARKQADRVGHYLEVRYEDLLTDTEGRLRQICEFIDLEFDDAMLSYHERAEERLSEKARELKRSGGGVQTAEARVASHELAKEPPKAEHAARWKREMDPEDVAKFEQIAGDLLGDFGYETTT